MSVHELARQPSPENWRLLCQELDRMPEPEALAAIEKLEPALDKWDDDLRATMCGMTWDDQFFDGTPNPRSKIVRYFRFDRYFTGRYGGGMRIRERSVTGATIRRMCASPVLANLTHLNLDYQLDTAGVTELAGCKHLTRLEKLELGGIEVGKTAVLKNLAAAAFFPRLKELSLTGCEITAATVGQLFRADGGPEYIDLTLNPLKADGARAIAKHIRKKPLRLCLETCELGDDGMAELAKISPPLERLELDDNAVTDAGVKALTSGSLRVEDVGLGKNAITSKGVSALLAWPLTKLRLSDNALDDAAALLLAKSAPNTLVELELGDNDITAKGLAALLGSSRLAGLKKLGVASNRIGAFADVAIELGELEALDLEFNRLGDGIRALAAIESEKLTKLSLANNVIDIRAFEELTGAVWFSRLIELDLADNPLGSAAGVVFGAWPIEKLVLSRTELGDSGAIALFDAGLKPKELVLSGCNLTDAAIEKLATSPTLAQLEILTLEDNAITERGARALMTAPRLQQLKLGNNRLNDDAVVDLAKWPQLLHLEADGNHTGKRAQTALDNRPARCCP